MVDNNKEDLHLRALAHSVDTYEAPSMELVPLELDIPLLQWGSGGVQPVE